jgi:hypothetical protein
MQPEHGQRALEGHQHKIVQIPKLGRRTRNIRLEPVMMAGS